MKRREFINRSFLTLGAVAIGQNITHAKALEELAGTFDWEGDNVYDLVINGGGMIGFFAALEAVRKGLKVLIVEKRTFLGFDITAKRKLWLDAKGFDQWSDDLKDLFFPKGEQAEILNSFLTGENNSLDRDRFLLFAGSLKKGMLRSLLVNKVDVLLMGDVCGVVTDASNKVSGVILASKHGILSVKCGHFIDTSDNCFFTRNLLNQGYNIDTASFIIEVEGGAENITANQFDVDNSLGISENKINIYKGKKESNQYLIEFGFSTSGKDISNIEQTARIKVGEICRSFAGISLQLSEAKLRFYALECSYSIKNEIGRILSLNNYDYIQSPDNNYSCSTIQKMIRLAETKVAAISKYINNRERTFIHHSGGKSKFTSANNIPVSESGRELPFCKYTLGNMDIENESTSLLIVGGGTAGAMAALGAAEKGEKAVVVEYFNDLGGTKTMAGVYDYYLGYQKHKFIEQQKIHIKEVASTFNMKLSMPRCHMYLADLLEKDCKIFNSSIFCEAELDGKQLKGIIICQNGVLKRINSTLTIDATGDADVAYLAGEGYDIGDSRMAITQNYSHWDVPYRPKVKNYNRDYDIINSTEILEQQRGLYLAHYESHYYDLYPMQAIRESRRPHGEYQLNVLDILSKKTFSDTIAQAKSDFDPHYFASSEYSRCAFMLPHYDNGELINIPYRSIVPKSIDGLLFSGKAISETYKALQFTRMSADITVLGYVTGMIAADIIKKGVRPRDYQCAVVCEDLKRTGYLPSSEAMVITNPENWVSKLSNGDESALFRCCITDKKTIVPLLTRAFHLNKTTLLAKALAWHGVSDGIETIITELKQLYNKEQQEGHLSTYFEVYDPSVLYWKINQDIALLGMCGSPLSNDIIKQILENTVSGGPRVAAPDAYNAGRIDLQLVPYYNRIVNLCFYVERKPDKQFIAGLERLLDDENIRGYKTDDYSQTRWKLYGANLELFISAASARCGSSRGIGILIDYLSDIHSDFRKFAHSELIAILKKDEGYTPSNWRKHLHTNVKPTVLIKSIEV